MFLINYKWFNNSIKNNNIMLHAVKMKFVNFKLKTNINKNSQLKTLNTFNTKGNNLFKEKFNFGINMKIKFF